MSTESPVNPGDVLVGKYRVDRVLGMGQMGIVVAATHLGLGQRVALKFMLATAGPDDERRTRFLREARACGELKTPHVARVTDVGALDSGAPYMVMEYLDGRDLDAVLRERGPLPVGEAVLYVLQACQAVAEAHAAGIVHRDLKPANLFLTTGSGGAPCIKVLDFGISKFTSESLKLTQEAAAMGSPLYMSPEALRSSRDVDARTDLWALGVVLFELTTGRTPFFAERVQELCARIWFGDPDPITRYRTDLPPGFEAVVMKCLARDRDQRFADVAELAAALAPFAPPLASYAESVASALGVAPARRVEALPVEAPLARSGGVGGSVSSPIALDAPAPARRTSHDGADPQTPGRASGIALVTVVIAGLVGLGLFVRTRSPAGDPRSSGTAEGIVSTAPETPVTAAPLPSQPPAAPDAGASTTAAVATTAAPTAKPAMTAPPAPPRARAPIPKEAPPAPEPPKAPAAKPPATTYNL